jgi:hypothetical protein
MPKLEVASDPKKREVEWEWLPPPPIIGGISKE